MAYDHSSTGQDPHRGEPARLLYTVPEAATALSIGRTLANELVRSGELPSVRVGRRRLVPAGALTEFVERRLRAAARS